MPGALKRFISATQIWIAAVWRAGSPTARALRRMMLAYRDGAKVFSGTFFTDETLPRETTVKEVISGGHTPQQAARVLSTVFSFTVGFTIEQQADEPKPGERNRRYEDAIQRRAQRGEAFTTALKSALLGDFDAQFEQSLAIILLGAKAWLGNFTRCVLRLCSLEMRFPPPIKSAWSGQNAPEAYLYPSRNPRPANSGPSVDFLFHCYSLPWKRSFG